MFDMGANKASGPDGFNPRFFQKYWGIVGASVIELVQTSVRQGKLPEGVNKALICLLAKVENPNL